MEAIPFVSAIFSVIGGAKSKSGYDDAAREQEAMAEKDAQNIQAEAGRQEEVSKERFSEEESLNKAKAAASGTTGEGSQAIFQGAQKDKFNKELDWLAKSADNRADIARRGGDYAATVSRNQGDQALWTGIGNAMSAWT